MSRGYEGRIGRACAPIPGIVAPQVRFQNRLLGCEGNFSGYPDQETAAKLDCNSGISISMRVPWPGRLSIHIL